MSSLWKPLPPIVVTASDETQSLTNGAHVDDGSIPRSQGRKHSLWYQWFWEITCNFLAVASIIAMAALLRTLENKRLQDDGLTISPNALVSILSAISKAAVLLPVASCIGQLKWAAMKRSRSSVMTLQKYDDASRGPLGSIVLLGSISERLDALSVLAAILILVSTLMDPFAQQIIHYQTQSRLVSNLTATFPFADSYDEGTEGLQGPSAHASASKDARMQSAIMSGIYQHAGEPTYHCPGSECSYPAHASLAICGGCQDVTAQVNRTCYDSFRAPITDDTHFNISSQTCYYDFPATFHLMATLSTDAHSGTVHTTVNSTWEPLDGSVGSQSPWLLKNAFIRFPGEDDTEGPNSTTWRDSMRADTCQLRLCVRGFDAAQVTNGSLSYTNPRSVDLEYQNVTAGSPNEPPLLMFTAQKPPASWPVAKSYGIGVVDFELLREMLSDLLTFQSAPEETGSMMIQTAIYTVPDLNRVFEQMSDAMSWAIMSGPNGTVLNGTVSEARTVITVQWPWILVPIIVVVGSSLLLACLMVSLGIQKSPVMWKSSILPFLLLQRGSDVGASQESRGRMHDLREEARQTRLDLLDADADRLRWALSARRLNKE